MSSYKHLFYIVCVMMLITFTSCGSGTTSTSTTDDTTDSTSGVSSLSDLPDITDMVASSESESSSISGALFAVSGTAPALVGLSEDDADDYFWGGLIAELDPGEGDFDASGMTADQIQSFWDGEGACRMAQEVGYSFQHLNEAGTSLCYMKNAPGASSGVEIVSGDLEDGEIPNMFSSQEETFTVQVNISGEEIEGEDGPETQDQVIFIRVYGTSSDEATNGYAADLWFCSEAATGTPYGYEQIRVNSTTNVMTQTNYDTGFGEFSAQFTGHLATDEEGNFIFDEDESQSVEVFFSESSDEFEFTFSSYVATQNGVLTTKSWFDQESGENSFGRKVYSLSNYSGADADTFALNSADFSTIWNNGSDEDSHSGSVEFQDTRYVVLDEDVTLYDFDGDSFWSGSAPTIDSTLAAGIEDYDCGTTPDIVVAMDMSDTTFQEEVQSECEARFSEMEFCDSDEIEAVRNGIFSSESFGDEEEDSYDE